MGMTARQDLTPPLLGSAKPRLAPPMPAVSDVAEFREVAASLGISLMPWQETSARYSEARGPDGRHLYKEFCEVVARQNGKTEKLVPLIVKRLRAGRRIMHTAQNRDLPRVVFARVAQIMSQDMSLFPTRNGRPVRPRFANGQEEIQLTNGGRYKIVAPTRGGARGDTNDDVIVDELREMETYEFIGAAKPTMTASDDPQIIYLSNAGDESSIVLNAIRDRADKDPRLAYLEWSADPRRDAGDPVGWAEANPALGHIPTMFDYLSGEYETALLENTLSIYEVEHNCRWVKTMRETLVKLDLWARRETTDETQASRTFMGISLDPSGTRASAALAWQTDEGKPRLRLLFDVHGHPINTDQLGRDLRDTARTNHVALTGFNPLTDTVLAKYFPRTEPITGNKFASASARFVSVVETGDLAWRDCAAVGTDLGWTARKEHDESGSFQAVRADDDRPITAALAAVNAVWLASLPQPRPTVRHPQAVGF
jgi:phage terminase large subunit-like protein